jgi:hypothetical protein
VVVVDAVDVVEEVVPSPSGAVVEVVVDSPLGDSVTTGGRVREQVNPLSCRKKSRWHVQE